MIARRMPDALKAAQIVLSVAAAIAIPSCHRRAAGPVVTLAHPNGLVLKIPEVIDGRAFAFAQTAAGFAYSEPRNVRTPTTGSVSFTPGVTPPAGDWPKTWTIRGRTIHHAVVEHEGGSGGTEYELRGWETARGGHISYVERQQTEWGPDWNVVRAIIEATSPPP